MGHISHIGRKGHLMGLLFKNFDIWILSCLFTTTLLSVCSLNKVTTLTDKESKWVVDHLSCGVHSKSSPTDWLSHCFFVVEKVFFVNCNAVSLNYGYWNTQVLVWARLSVTAKNFKSMSLKSLHEIVRQEAVKSRANTQERGLRIEQQRERLTHNFQGHSRTINLRFFAIYRISLGGLETAIDFGCQPLSFYGNCTKWQGNKNKLNLLCCYL